MKAQIRPSLSTYRIIGYCTVEYIDGKQRPLSDYVASFFDLDLYCSHMPSEDTVSSHDTTHHDTDEPQWLEHLWGHGNLFEIWVV